MWSGTVHWISFGSVPRATAIFTTAASAALPIHDNLATAQQSIQAAVKSNATATVTQLATTIGSLTGQLVALQNHAQAAFYGLLTTDQQAKMNQFAPAGMMGGSMMGCGMGAGMMGGGMGARMLGAGGPPWMRNQ
jgi:hypothetical protein